MKRLWIINHYAQKPNESGGIRHYSLSKYLQQHGWQACVIASSVELNTGRQRLQYGEDYRLEKVNEVEFLWLKTPTYTGNGFLRIWNMLKFTKAVLNLRYSKLLTKPDVIIGSTVHPFAAWAGFQVAKYYSVPFIYEVRDLWPETLIQFGRIKRYSLLSLLLGWLEKKVAVGAEHIITVLPRADMYFKKYGIAAEKITWIPNGIDSANIVDTATEPSTDRFTLTYLGAHGNANSLDTLIDAFSCLRDKKSVGEIYCQLVGDGPLKQALRDRAMSLGLDNIDFKDPLPRNKLPEIAEITDAFLLSLKDCPDLYMYGTSMNKLFDYMSMARPIIASLQVENDLVTETRCGVVVKPEQPELLGEAIMHVAALSQDERREMGARGRVAVESRYNYRILAKNLADILDNLHPPAR